MRTTGRRVTALLIAVSVLLIAADRWGRLTPLRTVGSAVFGSLGSAAASAVRWASGGERLAALERENARLRAALLRRPAAPRSSPGAADGYRVAAAHAIGFGRDHTVTIDAGSRDGVARDMTVFDGDGLIGRVVQVGPTTATVRLVTDPETSVGARLADSREVGMVTGIPGRNLLRLSMLSTDAVVRAGDRVVTLGSPNLRPYAPEIPIGTVVAVERTPGTLTTTALVRPFARFTALDLVTVVLGPSGEGASG